MYSAFFFFQFISLEINHFKHKSKPIQFFDISIFPPNMYMYVRTYVYMYLCLLSFHIKYEYFSSCFFVSYLIMSTMNRILLELFTLGILLVNVCRIFLHHIMLMQMIRLIFNACSKTRTLTTKYLHARTHKSLIIL